METQLSNYSSSQHISSVCRGSCWSCLNWWESGVLVKPGANQKNTFLCLGSTSARIVIVYKALSIRVTKSISVELQWEIDQNFRVITAPSVWQCFLWPELNVASCGSQTRVISISGFSKCWTKPISLWKSACDGLLKGSWGIRFAILVTQVSLMALLNLSAFAQV